MAVVLRTVLQKGRNVALERAKPRKGRFREEIGRREAQGGRGNVGLERGASQKCDNVGLERDSVRAQEKMENRVYGG